MKHRSILRLLDIILENHTENKMFKDVQEMHKKFGLEGPIAPNFLSEEEREFRIIAMEEELEEFIEAETLIDSIDALVDLAVFALGTAERMGFNWDAHWAEVMRANMQKELAGDASKSKRGFRRDLIKPEGWTPPRHYPIIARK